MIDTVREVEVRAPDGRQLAVQDRGPRDGPAVIAHHGTPSCRLDVPGGMDAPWSVGVRVVTFDRPGYGRSTSMPGRRVADAATDTRAVADALGLDRFGVIGVSGGGPHALAAAAALPGRVERVCVCVGAGPDGQNGFDATADALDATRREIELARSDPDGLRAFIEDAGGAAADFAAWMSSLPPSDQAVLARPEVAAHEEAVAAELAAGGIDGWLDDDLAFFGRPWGVDFAAITAPVLLLYGGADVLVPVSHGRALAQLIPTARLLIVPGGGHWLVDEQREALAWLAGDASILTTHSDWETDA